MLAIQRRQNETETVKVNLLPCKINYDGPVDVERKYWQPVQTEDGKDRAYFRGRELAGNALKVPEGYKGSILRVTGNIVPISKPPATQDDDDEDDEADQENEETKVVEELGTFDEVMIWNHDVPWDASEDPYAKGIDEWMAFANAMHSQTEDAEPSKKTS